jgi:hypothetical protein
MSDVAAHTARQLEMIEAMTECAFALGQAGSELAKRAAAAGDSKAYLRLSAEFRHCAFAVRMGIRLAIRLRAGETFLRTAPAAEPTENERERERAETAETPAADRDEREFERERSEPVSLPEFLKSLGLAAAAAERRKDQLPPQVRETTLPALKRLLVEAKTNLVPARPAGPERPGPVQAAATLVLDRPTVPSPAARARLLGGAALPTPPLRRRHTR